MRKKHIVAIITIIMSVLPVVAFLLFYLHFALPAPIYETDSIDDYGIYKGNYDNDTPSEFILSFFPNEIEDSFSHVVYHYKAIKFDTYAFEAYLEFQIADPTVFAEYIETQIDNAQVIEYEFNPDFLEYTVSDPFVADIYEIRKNDTSVSISRAKIGKILYSESQQKVIFWALGVYDGGGTKANELNFFFSKFDIDPVEYAEKRDRTTG